MTTMATPDAIEDVVPIDFCTLGMFIIDEIHPPPNSPDQSIQKDIVGGAGTYSAVGARLFSPAPQLSRSVAWIVDTGPDFPPAIRESLLAWRTAVWLRAREDGGPTTRGWNGYSGNEHRAFRYLTPKRRLIPADLTPHMLRSRSFHLISSPDRCVDVVTGIYARQREVERGGDAPVLIWEPVPDRCTPDELDATYAACAHVDVVSPNHAELAALFGFSHGEEQVVKAAVEEHAQRLLDRGVGRSGNGAVVVRAGADGCFVLNSKVKQWLPAVHRNAEYVVDPTGGGNGFLGGFAVGLVRNHGDILEAARWGSVAASFAIEQVGMPVLSRDSDTDTGTDEKWNGASVFDRLDEFRKRTT